MMWSSTHLTIPKSIAISISFVVYSLSVISKYKKINATFIKASSKATCCRGSSLLSQWYKQNHRTKI